MAQVPKFSDFRNPASHIHVDKLNDPDLIRRATTFHEKKYTYRKDPNYDPTITTISTTNGQVIGKIKDWKPVPPPVELTKFDVTIGDDE